jgi:hypothetical protein
MTNKSTFLLIAAFLFVGLLYAGCQRVPENEHTDSDSFSGIGNQ